MLEDEPFQALITASETVFRGAVWNLKRETFEYNGHPVVREFVAHPGAVSVLAIDENDRILLIKQYRHPIRSREWEIPAGLCDVSGESALDTAKRELAEEVELQAENWWVLSDYVATPGGNDEVVRIFLARGLTRTAQSFERHHEEADLQLCWTSLDEAFDAALARRVHNPALLIAIFAAHASRERRWETLAPAQDPWPDYDRVHAE